MLKVQIDVLMRIRSSLLFTTLPRILYAWNIKPKNIKMHATTAMYMKDEMLLLCAMKTPLGWFGLLFEEKK